MTRMRVRGGRFYTLELRWDGVDSLARGLAMIREQATRTPQGHWVRVIGGWSPYQFQEADADDYRVERGRAGHADLC